MNESQLIRACWERRLIEPPAGFEPERRSTTAKQSAAVAKPSPTATGPHCRTADRLTRASRDVKLT